MNIFIMHYTKIICVTKHSSKALCIICNANNYIFSKKLYNQVNLSCFNAINVCLEILIMLILKSLKISAHKDTCTTT